MIGQGQDSHAFLERTRNQYCRRESAIGGRAMAVQINIHGTFLPQISWRYRAPICLLLCRHILLLAATVKQFIDFIPLLLFFIVFKLDPRVVDIAGHEVTVGGIYSATAMLIISSLVVYGTLFIKQRKLEKSQWLTLIACLVFGSLTLAFHSETFLKWKAPVVNWLFALAFIGSHFVGEQLLIKRIMGHALTLPEPVWTRLNIAWIGFFLFCGAANLFVAFTFQDYWVDFKVFGSLGMTLLFLVGQGIYLSRHLHDADTTTPKTED
jgi:intracellular septation protein